MSEDRPGGQWQDPTDPYGRPETGRSGQPRPVGADGSGAGGPQRQEQRWPSATQRREHPESTASGGAGSAFLVALLATAVGLAVTLLASYTAVHTRGMSLYARVNLATGGLATWPSGRRGSIENLGTAGTGNFVLTFVVAGVVLFLLLWAALGSTPGGRGALAVLLAGWGATVVAGVVALVVAYFAISHHARVDRVLTLALNNGADWAVRVGWVVGVVAALGQSLRRRRGY